MKTLLILTMLVLCLPSISVAQPDLITWFPSVDSCEKMASRLLVPMPVLRSDMSWEVATTYIAADSICKTFTRMQVDSIVSSLSDDSLRIAMRSISKCKNYDYLLFYHQLGQSEVYKPEYYKSSLLDLARAVSLEYQKRYGEYNSITYSLFNSMVIRARVLCISEKTTSGEYGDTSWPYDSAITHNYCADLVPSEVIFGNPRNYFCNDPSGETSTCVRCSWSSVDYGPRKVYHSPPRKLFKQLETGKEYLFIIDKGLIGYIAVNGFLFTPTPLYAFEIDNNEMVHDPENVFDLGESYTIESIKDHILYILGL